MSTQSRASVITTVTLNPALDEAVSIERLVVGGTNRCRFESLDPGGKGINASRVIQRLGRPTLALGFLGGVTGGMLRDRLDLEGVPHAFDDVEGMTRLNVMIYEASLAQRTRIYLPGAVVDPEQAERLRQRLTDVAAGGVVVLGGSLPPGLAPDTYRDLVGWLRERGVRTVVDTSGPALAAVLAARPTLIKPNTDEAAEVLGRPIDTIEHVLEAARELQRRGAEQVVISQGAHGAIGLGPDGAYQALPPEIVAQSAVGSGDSMVAGLAIALAEGWGLDEGLRLGTAAGAATALIPGTQLCQPDDVKRFLSLVVVRKVALVPA